MRNEKQRTNRVGGMAFDVPSVVPTLVPSVVPFPGESVRRRVVIERPLPTPERRVCPFCCAVFDDYTNIHNTTYCSRRCCKAMSKLKRRTAILTLAQVTNVAQCHAADVCDDQGLPAVERLLAEFGYRFEDKQWLKRP